MADVNYTNPGALLGSSKWQPDGLLGGMIYGQNRDMGKEQFTLSQLISQISAAKQGAELQDYNQAAPFRQADRGFKMDKMPLELEQLRGTNQTTNLANMFTAGTQPGKIATTNVENTQKITDAQMVQLRQAAGLAQTIAAITRPDQAGPHTIPMIQQMIQRFQIDPNHPILKAILSTSDPREIHKRANDAFAALDNMSQPHRTTMQQEGADTERAYGVQKLANQGSMAVARERAKAKDTSTKQLLDNLAKVSPENRLASLHWIMQDQETDQQLRHRAQQMYEQDKRVIESRNDARGQPQVVDGRIVYPKSDVTPRDPARPNGPIDFNSLPR